MSKGEAYSWLIITLVIIFGGFYVIAVGFRDIAHAVIRN
jgi:hypothetical protein